MERFRPVHAIELFALFMAGLALIVVVASGENEAARIATAKVTVLFLVVLAGSVLIDHVAKWWRTRRPRLAGVREGLRKIHAVEAFAIAFAAGFLTLGIVSAIRGDKTESARAFEFAGFLFAILIVSFIIDRVTAVKLCDDPMENLSAPAHWQRIDLIVVSTFILSCLGAVIGIIAAEFGDRDNSILAYSFAGVYFAIFASSQLLDLLTAKKLEEPAKKESPAADDKKKTAHRP